MQPGDVVPLTTQDLEIVRDGDLLEQRRALIAAYLDLLPDQVSDVAARHLGFDPLPVGHAGVETA